MKLKIIILLLRLISISCFAQTTNYLGDWINTSGNRKLTVTMLTEGKAVSITDASTTDTLAIDYYDGQIENGKIILPADSTEHLAPYCEISQSNDSLFYTCQGLFKKNELITDTFVRHFEHDNNLQKKYLKPKNNTFQSKTHNPFSSTRVLRFDGKDGAAIGMFACFDRISGEQMNDNEIHAISEIRYSDKFKPNDTNIMIPTRPDCYINQKTELADPNKRRFKVLAKLVSFEGGDKIHFARFKVLKNLSQNPLLQDTITVGYYNYKQPDNHIDDVLLTFQEYDGQGSTKSFFICPNYDGKKYIQPANIEFVNIGNWKGCDPLKGNCKTLIFTRAKNKNNWFLMVTGDNSETAVTVSLKNSIKALSLNHDCWPACIELTNLNDGVYDATVLSAGTGGTVIFKIATAKR